MNPTDRVGSGEAPLRARPYRGTAPDGSVIVNLVKSGDRVMGYVSQVDVDPDGDSIHPTEIQPVDDVWRTARNKQSAVPAAAIFVRMEAGMEWDERWGVLEE